MFEKKIYDITYPLPSTTGMNYWIKYNTIKRKVTEHCNSSISKSHQLISDVQLYYTSLLEVLAFLDTKKDSLSGS
jgi:hypothetical protein